MSPLAAPPWSRRGAPRPAPSWRGFFGVDYNVEREALIDDIGRATAALGAPLSAGDVAKMRHKAAARLRLVRDALCTLVVAGAR